MSKNIKEIGKELLGKSLNSFHRKTGLTQLEKNNEMQDGILDGILSQVDDTYIEKTEQSNVMHLDGSGDGVVVLDSIEGSTMVNLLNRDAMRKNLVIVGVGEGLTQYNNGIKITSTQSDDGTYKFKCKFTLDKSLNGRSFIIRYDNPYPEKIKMCIYNSTLGQKETNYTNINPIKISLPNDNATRMIYFDLGNMVEGTTSQTTYIIDNIMFLVDYDLDRLMPISYFEGLQSSFEEKVNDEGKYEIEILSNNKNLLNIGKIEENIGATAHPAKITVKNNKVELNNSDDTSWIRGFYKVKVKPNTKYIFTSIVTKGMVVIYRGSHLSNNFSWDTNYIYSYLNYTKQENRECIMRFTTDSDEEYIYIRFSNEGVQGVSIFESPMVEKSENKTEYNSHKQNKIKLLLNDPLRGIDKFKDRLYIKDNKLVIERNNYSQEITPNIGYIPFIKNNSIVFAIKPKMIPKGEYGVCNIFATDNNGWGYIQSEESDDREFCQFYSNFMYIHIKKSRLSSPDAQGINEWLSVNKVVLVYPLEEPYYEEVLNEYGEPIILEGYENGTLYIDSTVIPITTVRYTPKMESFKTLKEVNKNNNLITLDINENIIPYMMDVDYMIMEKELCLLNTKNIRKMEELDMTSMQKRTQDMLERLIKGKTLTEQECKTRVTTYLNAGKITDEQAEELMLVISEVYA